MSNLIDINNPKNEKKLIKTNGVNLEVIENKEYKENKAITFFDWVANTLDHSAQAAWNFKQGEINALIQDWNYSVCWGKDKLKETIDSVTLLNKHLQEKIKKLQVENEHLKQELSKALE